MNSFHNSGSLPFIDGNFSLIATDEVSKSKREMYSQAQAIELFSQQVLQNHVLGIRVERE